MDAPQKLIKLLASNPLRLESPSMSACQHQVLYAGQTQLACSCDLSGLESIIQAINSLAQALSNSDKPTETEPPADQKPAKPIPTPLKPPSYRPPLPVALGGWDKEAGDSQFSLRARVSLQELEVSEETALQVIESPDFTSPGPDASLLYFHGQGLTVLCNAADFKIINLYRFDATRFHSSTERVSGQSKTDTRAPKPQDMKDFITLAEGRGLVVEKQHSGHFKISHPEIDGLVSTGSTPSDPRSMDNLLSQVRSTFGIDLRQV